MQLQLPVLAIEASSNSSASVSSSSASAKSVPSAWRQLLDEAEPIYQESNYKEVLPLYEKAVKAATAGGASKDEEILCRRYLADVQCRVHQPDDALVQYGKIEALLTPEDVVDRIININDQALCYGLKVEFDKAEALCRSAEKLCGDKEELLWELARTQAQIAYIDYMRAKYSSAIAGFQIAAKTIDKSGRKDLPAEVLRQKLDFAQGGSYYHLKQFAEALPHFQRLYESGARLFGKTDLQTGWAMLALSDILERLNRREEADAWHKKSIYVFRKFNLDRLTKEIAPQLPPGTDIHALIQKRINTLVFGRSGVPVDLQDTQEPICKRSSEIVNMHDPRSMYAQPFSSAPGHVWLNPRVEQRGIVIAIHGLSLQSSSYAAFAKELADVGFCTVAFDMRGFGAYRQALGAEHLDFDGCMRDLHHVVSAIRTDNPDTPIFILGESMGGAIALQFAAQYPELVDGLVASVPAGKRFKQRQTAVRVALRFLENKNRPFDIGTDVINQATHDPRVKEAWAGDLKTRSMLSPRELIAFQSMCDRNIEYARQIENTPVIIFQGVSDMLVKPEATYDLFRAIECKDKSLVMVGNAEHLIFEEGCFTPAVLKGLVAWMESHRLPAVKGSETVPPKN